jgi:hypothetical protein
MIKNGTWKGEPASEEAWEVDWSIAEPDPEFLEREAFHTLYPDNRVRQYEFNGQGI